MFGCLSFLLQETHDVHLQIAYLYDDDNKMNITVKVIHHTQRNHVTIPVAGHTKPEKLGTCGHCVPSPYTSSHCLCFLPIIGPVF